MHIALAFLAVSACTIFIDFLWIGVIARNTLVGLIKPYLTLDANGNLVTRMPYAIACWLLLVIGNYIFVNQSIPSESNWTSIFLRGALFGTVTYGVYDLTNAALQIQWPALMILLDVSWGATLCGICALLWNYFLRKTSLM